MPEISRINQNYQAIINQLNKPINTDTSTASTDSFSKILSQTMDTLNQNISVIDQDTKNIISGKETDLGSVMTRMTEAQLTVQTAVQIRNKCLEAYNDLKNMQF